MNRPKRLRYVCAFCKIAFGSEKKKSGHTNWCRADANARTTAFSKIGMVRSPGNPKRREANRIMEDHPPRVPDWLKRKRLEERER